MNQLLARLLFSAIIASFSYRLRFLTVGGASAQFVLGVILHGLGGWQWTVPMLVFFLPSSLLSRFGKVKKQPIELVFEKSSV